MPDALAGPGPALSAGRPPLSGLFRTLLGAALDGLPDPVRRLHSLDAPCLTAGLADVTMTPGLLPALICRLTGLPRAGRDVPVTVLFTPGPAGEHWERRFADRHYGSRLAVAEGRLIESFGPFRLAYDLEASAAGLAWTLVRWRLLGLPLPDWTRPRIDCLESSEAGRYRFDIAFALPVIGKVIAYTGWLKPAQGSADADASTAAGMRPSATA